MVLPIGAPRLLLRRLREIMAEPVSAQERLDRITRLVASNMVAEVSSIYLRRRDGSLELFATEGLRPEAVHTTHLKRGEGLVGLIAEQAEPLNLTEAQDHPSFSYRPETGEEVYHSFLGVPVFRGGNTLGVLTVQNMTPRHYNDEEVEALQTTAMVLAEMIASGALGAIGDATAGVRQEHSVRVNGVAVAEGIALGHVVLHEPRIVIARLIGDDIATERRRLNDAIDALMQSIDDMLGRGDLARAGEHRDVLETYRMFANDRGWRHRLDEALATGLSAEAAVERVQNNMRARMLRNPDPYLRERLHDFDDLSNRLLRLLTGKSATAAAEILPFDAILVARTMGPAELLDYDRRRLRGLVLEESGPASHVAIVARALGIAAVGQAEGMLAQVEPGDAIVVDCEAGEVHLRPPPDVITAYSDKVRFRARQQAQYAKLRDKPAVTKDGTRISLNINAGLLVDLPHLQESGADGIGLFRTELQFMISSSFPRLDQQARFYAAIMEAAHGKPVVFRSLDIGGDKVLPYFRRAQEENPALGWRAIRMALDRPALFRSQIRALLRAAAGRELRIMLPMITDVAEVLLARSLVDHEMALLERYGRPQPETFRLGVMIEVPALIWQLDRLLPVVDFVSVGSNDLFQFLFAADRSNARVANRFDTLHPAAMHALKTIVAGAAKHGVPATLCGEIAGRPLEAMALIGLGFRSISMPPASIGPVKSMIRALEIAALGIRLDALLAESSPNLREGLRNFASETRIPL